MNDDLEKLWQKIKTQRDELVVQSHLAKAEFKDEWEKLESKWAVAEKNLGQLEQEARDATDEVSESAKVVMEELSSAYDRIVDRLKD